MSWWQEMAPRYSVHSLFNCPRRWRSTDFLVEGRRRQGGWWGWAGGCLLQSFCSLTQRFTGGIVVAFLHGWERQRCWWGRSARSSFCCFGAVMPEPRLAAARFFAKTSSASRVHSPFIPVASLSFWTEARAELMTSRVTGSLDGWIVMAPAWSWLTASSGDGLGLVPWVSKTNKFRCQKNYLNFGIY